VLISCGEASRNCFIYIYIYIGTYFPGVARVFIYPNLIVMCVPSLAEIAHLGGILSIVTSTLLGGTLPTYCYIFTLTIQWSTEYASDGYLATAII
jgi:hypothetical protein